MGNAIPEYVKVRSFIYSLAVNRTDPMQKKPSEKELCSMFQVSRVTVRNALEPLVSSGVLICKRGMGTFVNPAFQTNRERNSYTLGYIRYGGMQSTGQLTGSAADAIELCGMDYEPLDTASGSVNQFSELLKGLSGIVWDFYMERSRPYLDILHRSGRPYLLLTQEKQLQCDVIREDKAAEGRLLTEYALKNGHRHILFLCRTEPEAQLLEGTTYSNAMRILFNIPPDQPVPGDHLLHYSNLHDFIRKPEFKKFTMIYAGGTIARQFMQELNNAGISVPDDISVVTYGNAHPRFFGGLTPVRLSLKNELENAVIDWLIRRVVNKETGGTFERTVSVQLYPGQTVKKQNERM